MWPPPVRTMFKKTALFLKDGFPNQTLLLCRTIRNKWSLQIVCLGTERKKYKIHLLTQTALAKYYCSLVCKRTSSPVLPKTSWRWQDAVTVLGIYKKKHATTDDFVSLCILSARRQGLIDGSDARDCFSHFVLIWAVANHFHERIAKGRNGFKQRRLSWRVMFQLQSFSYSCGYHSRLQVIEAITMTLSASTPNISRILFQEFDS